MKTIVILQINKDKARHKMFLSYDTIHGNVNLNDYRAVWAGRRDIKSPEDIYAEFNLNPPEDFYGHSLSVSDIVSIDGELWFCDNIGFVKL